VTREFQKEHHVELLRNLQIQLDPCRDLLLNHPIYQEIDRIESLRTFMEHHVFAVWDFMSLLKALQRSLCCVDVPWVPAFEPSATRLINEIVLAEESDVSEQGSFASHFELYRKSMLQCGASTTGIDGFVNALRAGTPVSRALDLPCVPEAARVFVRHTFTIIESGSLCSIAAAFTFGREDLLPAIFQRIVDELNVDSQGALDTFQYYLVRHIGLDGDEHGPMAKELVVGLCGTDESKWQLAIQSAVASLQARLRLWDAITEAIRK
jgi:hypothetical protein